MYQEEAHPDIESLHPLPQEDGSDLNTPPTPVEDQGQGRSLTDVLFGPNRHVTWPEHAIRSLVGAFKVPGEVYQGNIDMNAPEGVEKATDLALATMTGGIGGVAKAGTKAAPMAELDKFLGRYFETLPADVRNSATGKSHPGFKFDVIDDTTGALAKESPKAQDNLTRALTQARLLNEYHNTDKFTLKVYPTDKLTAGEKKVLNQHNLMEDYLKAITPPERSTVLGSGPIRPANDNMTKESIMNKILDYKEIPPNPYRDALDTQQITNMIRGMDKTYKSTKNLDRPKPTLIDK